MGSFKDKLKFNETELREHPVYNNEQLDLLINKYWFGDKSSVDIPPNLKTRIEAWFKLRGRHPYLPDPQEMIDNPILWFKENRWFVTRLRRGDYDASFDMSFTNIYAPGDYAVTDFDNSFTK